MKNHVEIGVNSGRFSAILSGVKTTGQTGATMAGVNTALIIVILSSFLTPFMGSALNVALPAIGERFSVGAIVLGWVATAYILAAAVFLLPFGRLADMYGRRRVFLGGMIVYTLGSTFSAAATSAVALIIARVVNGAGAAMMFATGTAILVSAVPSDKRGKVLGWNVAAVYLGLSLGPFLGGVIANDLGWRWIFIINAIAGLVATAFVFWKLEEEPADTRGEQFDSVGSVVYAVTLVALMFGLSLLPKVEGMTLVFVGCIGFVLFLRWELKTCSPVFDVRVFAGNRVFAFSNMAALISYSATSAVAFILSLYLQYAKELTPRQAGLVLIAQPVVMTVFSPIAGRLSDRIEPWKLASLGMAVTAVGLGAFCFLRETTSLWFVVMSLAVLGFGFALFSSPNTNAVMSSVGQKHYGIASSTLATMRLAGNMLSMGIVMLIIALVMGHTRITPEVCHLFMKCARAAFAVFAVLCVLGVFASLTRRSESGLTPTRPPLLGG